MTFDDIKPNVSYSALSGMGVMLFGDRKSIDKVLNWEHEASTVESFWRPEVLKLRKQLENVKNVSV